MKLFFSFIPVLIISTVNAQEFNSDFKAFMINKKVKEFPDKFDLSSPLSSFVTLKYILINGRDGLQWKICAADKRSLLPDSTAPDSKVTEDIRRLHLNTNVEEIVFYKDSVAFVISRLIQDNGETFYSVRNFHPEHDKWVVNGEDLFQNIESANKYIQNRATQFFEDFQLSRSN